MGLLLAVAGGYLASTWLASGFIVLPVSRNAILRTTAPFEFLVLTAGAMAAAGIGICVVVVLASRPQGREAITNYVESMTLRLEEHYGSRLKVFEYAGLFCILAVIYSLYLQGILNGPQEIDLRRVGRFCLISAVPFGGLAFFDASWRSSDAAPTAFVAWAAVFLAFSEMYGGGCPPTAAFYFTPLVFSALVAHMIGTVRHGFDLSES